MELVVANIADNVFWEIWYPCYGQKSPAEIRLADEVSCWNEQNIPFKFVGEFGEVRKVVAADHMVIPG